MSVNAFLTRLRNLDAYPKTLEDFRVKTFGGAAVTIVSAIIMVILFASELNYYLTREIHPELFVDTAKGQKLKINIDVSFPEVGCSYLSIDAMDVAGEQQIDVDHNIFKQRLDKEGVNIPEVPEKHELGDQSEGAVKSIQKPLDPARCESCYGAENAKHKCCNTCEDVRDAYRLKGWAFTNADEIEQCKREGWSDKMKDQKDEGCRVFGFLEVNKVAGNFHIAPGKSFQQHHVHVHDLNAFGSQKFNLSHFLAHLSFGDDYPGQVNPLDSVSEISPKASMMYQYFVKVVPTTYVNLNQEILFTNQFSVTRHQKVVGNALTGESGLPGLFFMYEISPMMVKYTEVQRSFMHFLTGVCAIIGGIFTVAGLIDSFIYHSSRAIQKKIEIGKAS